MGYAYWQRMKRKRYLEHILEEFMDTSHAHVDTHVKGIEGAFLGATVTKSTSRIGVVIVPGISVPRESYFPLVGRLSRYKVLTYDLRGQSHSEGVLDGEKCVEDVNFIGNEFRRVHNLDYLVGIGHSYGGMALLEAGTKEDHPYDYRIALAPPLDLKKSSDRMPERLTNIIGYLYILKKAMAKDALRDEIVRHYESFSPLEYLRNPYVVALRLKDPKAYNRTRETTSLLGDLVGRTKMPIALVFAGADDRVNISNPDYDMVDVFSNLHGFPVDKIDRLSHRFNSLPEDRFIVSYNNTHVLDKVEKIIRDAVR
jgi:pimeloyl-ACP methyl ester carboxylesterase